MVITRSQTRKNTNITIDGTEIYRGFYIKNPACKTKIDKLMDDIEQMETLKYTEGILEPFWKSITISEIKIPKELTMEQKISLLESMVSNEEMWQRFVKICQKLETEELNFLAKPNTKQLMSKGVGLFSFQQNNDGFIVVNIQQLREFAYWFKYINSLYISIMRNVLECFPKINNSKERYELFRVIFKTKLLMKPFIHNRFVPEFGNGYQYRNLMKRLLPLISRGLEICLYTFAAFHPELVCDDVYPYINKKDKLYKHPCSTVDISDSTFGKLKEKYYQYY